jgi:hypothetical protein
MHIKRTIQIHNTVANTYTMYDLNNEINSSQAKNLGQSSYCDWLSIYLNSKLDRASDCINYLKEEIDKTSDPISHLVKLKNNLYYQTNHTRNHNQTLTKIIYKRYVVSGVLPGFFLWFRIGWC